MTTRIITLFLSLSLMLALCAVGVANPLQGRDHLTPQEVDLVKDAQILDKRVEIFIKAVDRRMLVINNSAEANAKLLKKDSEKWGELPTGTRAQLMSDISRIFDEAITNIDDVSARDEKNPLIPKALRKLATAATRIVEQLKPIAGQIKGDSETSTFDQLTENAESIIQAANKLPAAVEKKSKNKSEKTTN
ncbi:MAG TPA: hypothetical protein VEW46_21560 [Pyrinomonadaceae bacterium]|nr:hypothetical protein [Pyrinomonadaceae bacterium]